MKINTNPSLSKRSFVAWAHTSSCTEGKSTNITAWSTICLGFSECIQNPCAATNCLECAMCPLTLVEAYLTALLEPQFHNCTASSLSGTGFVTCRQAALSHCNFNSEYFKLV
jgi:hypothetical protein